MNITFSQTINRFKGIGFLIRSDSPFSLIIPSHIPTRKEANMKTPIQSLLFRAGISQAKVAAQLGINAKTASQKLTGQKDFWWREVVALCDLLGIENPREVFPNGIDLQQDRE